MSRQRGLFLKFCNNFERLPKELSVRNLPSYLSVSKKQAGAILYYASTHDLVVDTGKRGKEGMKIWKKLDVSKAKIGTLIDHAMGANGTKTRTNSSRASKQVPITIKAYDLPPENDLPVPKDLSPLEPANVIDELLSVMAKAEAVLRKMSRLYDMVEEVHRDTHQA